jgi:hypothetical protein
MKKLILASILGSVGLFAQSGTTPAAPAPAKPNADSTQGQSQAKPKVHRHKKGVKAGSSSVAPAAKPATPSK